MTTWEEQTKYHVRLGRRRRMFYAVIESAIGASNTTLGENLDCHLSVILPCCFIPIKYQRNALFDVDFVVIASRFLTTKILLLGVAMNQDYNEPKAPKPRRYADTDTKRTNPEADRTCAQYLISPSFSLIMHPGQPKSGVTVHLKQGQSEVRRKQRQLLHHTRIR